MSNQNRNYRPLEEDERETRRVTRDNLAQARRNFNNFYFTGDNEKTEISKDILRFFHYNSGSAYPTYEEVNFLVDIRSLFPAPRMTSVKALAKKLIMLSRDFDYSVESTEDRRIFLQLYNITTGRNNRLESSKNSISFYFRNGANSSEIKKLIRESGNDIDIFRRLFVPGMCLVNEPECPVEMCHHCSTFWNEVMKEHNNNSISKATRFHSYILFGDANQRIICRKAEINALSKSTREILEYKFGSNADPVDIDT